MKQQRRAKRRAATGSLFDTIPESTPDAPSPIVESPVSWSPPPPAVIAPSDGKMQKEALVFLDDPLARKLAIAWQACDGDERAWLDAAGIASKDTAQARQLCKALLKNKICQTGGAVDRLALNYIGAKVAESLTKRKPKGG